jgi:hypothetical protein
MIKAIDTTTSRRALLTGAPAAAAAALAASTAVNGLVLAVASPSDSDPIFAAIAAHRAAIEFYTLQLDELDEDTPLQTLTRCDDTLWDVLTVEPTTMAGVVALLEYVGHHEFLNDDALGEDSLENTVLSAAFQAGGELEQAAQNFPPRLAETIRSILAHGRGGG